MSIDRTPLTMLSGGAQPSRRPSPYERPLRLGATCAGLASSYYRTKLYCRFTAEAAGACEPGGPMSLGSRCTGRVVFQ